MAFTGNFMCTSFKLQLLNGVHDFDLSTGDTFKIALYTNTAAFTAATAEYTTGNEITGTAYVAGGNTLTKIDPTSTGTTAFCDFADSTWSTATFTARGALIYNSTPNTTSGAAVTAPTVVVLDFLADKTATAGDFTVIFPTADSTNAIIRIA